MEIKGILTECKKNFERLILAVIILVLIVSFLKYLALLKGKALGFEEKDLYALVGIPWRPAPSEASRDAFQELIDRKANFILGAKSLIFYKRLISRNPFAPLMDLVVKPPSLEPANLKIGIGERVAFRFMNGIGPYKWRVEPEGVGTFEGDEFITKSTGSGKVIATDARGYDASAEIEVMAKKGAVILPASDEGIKLVYRGNMAIGTRAEKEVLAIVENTRTGKTSFLKSGEEIGGFIVKDISQEKLVLFDKNKSKEVELRRQ